MEYFLQTQLTYVVYAVGPISVFYSYARGVFCQSKDEITNLWMTITDRENFILFQNNKPKENY